MEILDIIKERSALLFWFGLANVGLALLFIVMSFLTDIQVAGANAWFKPIKFALSIAILTWTLAWFMGYLEPSRTLSIVSWVFTISLAFEIIYIGWQAGQGVLSHFNVSTPFLSFMYTLMAIGASVATLCVGYVGMQFFLKPFPDLPQAYLWAIRLGTIIFVIFSFEGFVMGSRMSHTIGGPDGGPGLFFLGWSTLFGDPRIAHFIGMHSIQILPLVAWYLLRNTTAIWICSTLYLLVAAGVLVQALRGNPFIPMKAKTDVIEEHAKT